MMKLRPRLVSLLAARQRGGSRMLVGRNLSDAPHNKPIAPKSASSSTAAAAVTITGVVAGSIACYYVWTNNDLARRHQSHKSSPQHRRKLAAYLVSPANRVVITQSVNSLVNIPGLGEHVEGIIIRKAVDKYMDALEQIVVGGDTDDVSLGDCESSEEDDDLLRAEALELTKPLGEEDALSQQQAKDELVEKINAKVDIYGISETQEAVLIRAVVNQLFALYPGLQQLLVANSDE